MKQAIGFVLFLLIALPMAIRAQEVKTDDADTIVMTVVEQQPEYKGGLSALYADLSRSGISYPERARAEGLQGVVIVKFIVEKDGSITHAKVVKDELGYGAGEGVLECLKNLKTLEPARQGGKTVRAEFTLPVRFQLYDSDSQQKDSGKRESRNKRKK